MPEWLVERGIGETRAVRIAGGEIVEARILLDGIARAGTRCLAHLGKLGPPTVAEVGGEEYLLPKGAPGETEGAKIVIEVSREQIPGPETWKRPLARITNDEPGQPPQLEGDILPFPAPGDRLGDAGWNDLIEQARTGVIRFTGGELRISPTPAMTLIDVDGYLPARELALAGAAAAAHAILRLDIGGSIGIDLPTIAGKMDRQAVGEMIDRVLPKPFERTAMNGFGFVQIVRPRQRASLVEQAQDRAAFEARALLRLASFEPPGPKCLVAHPAVVGVLKQQDAWLDELARQLGGAVSLRVQAALPMSGGYAENV